MSKMIVTSVTLLDLSTMSKWNKSFTHEIEDNEEFTADDYAQISDTINSNLVTTLMS